MRSGKAPDREQDQREDQVVSSRFFRGAGHRTLGIADQVAPQADLCADKEELGQNRCRIAPIAGQCAPASSGASDAFVATWSTAGNRTAMNIRANTATTMR